MNRTRISLTVLVDLDPVPGTFHEPEDFERHIAGMLTNAFPWYSPVVVLNEAVNCGAEYPSNRGSCHLTENHAGEHRNDYGTTWA